MPRAALLYICVLVLAVWASLPTGAQAASRFVSVIDDLPLMAGLNEIGEGVTFSSPNGRIAEVLSEGALSRQAVLDFYARTLPQLGWARVAETRFVREGETLSLNIEKTKTGVQVRFALAPDQ